MKECPISDTGNREKIAIVVVGYDRLASTRRLLDSLAAAVYETNDVPLVVSIDCSGNEELYRYVSDFEWTYGNKYVFIRQERLGLKNHIFQCGDLSCHFKAVVILEDDVFAAPDFYRYMVAAVEKYGADEHVACISGYFNPLYGYVGLPHVPMADYDVFAMQEVSSTGECFTAAMWQKFRTWFSLHDPDSFDMDHYEIPEQIKRWRRAWTKFYNTYMVEKDLYCIYPVFPVITNCGDAGEHNAGSMALVQTGLMMGRRDYSMPDFTVLPRYDIFGNNTALYDSLNLGPDELCLDLYGNNPNINGKRYVLTIRKMPYKAVRSFGLSFRPQELNVMMHVPGPEIVLYDTSVPEGKRTKAAIPDSVIIYHLHGFNIWFLLQVVIGQIRNSIRKRLRLK